ncbi:MAG: transketolase family protein [Candidatus Dormibacteraceae bacterium]
MGAKTVSAPFATALVELGNMRRDIVVLSADLSKYTDVQPFAETFPDRFIQVGMAEQNMMGVAGGLAKSGFLPIAVTYGVFASRRSHDQVAMALATGQSRGIVVGFLPGIVTPFRATHQATDDLALMRTIPGMTVMDPADATELSAALKSAVYHDGPVYLRGQRGDVVQLFAPEGFSFTIGDARVLRESGEVGVIATGLGTQWALEAVDLLAARGRPAALLHLPTLKPLIPKLPIDFCRRFETVVTVENHSTIGGLASVVGELIAAHGVGTRVHALGVPDRWAPGGSVGYIREQLHLDAAGLADAIEANVGMARNVVRTSR